MHTNNPKNVPDTCVFCAMAAGTIPVRIVSENRTVFVIKDIAPQAPIHYLIIPKKHVCNIQSIEPHELGILQDIGSIVQELAQTDTEHQEFKLLSNNGKRAGQHVMHLHVHFLAGYK